MAEGMARAVLEAMASGLPVITTAEAGYGGVIRDGENGFLVPARDPHAIADVLKRLAADPVLRADVGRAARASAEDLSWERHGRGFLDVLRDDGGSAAR
jgi:glycosyltransferase involved in cell wall biosynthesis